MSNRPETPIDVDTNPPAKAYDSVMVEPTFVLLFSVHMRRFQWIFAHPHRTSSRSSEHLQPSELERHVFGENFAAAGRTQTLASRPNCHAARRARRGISVTGGRISRYAYHRHRYLGGLVAWTEPADGCFAVDCMARSGFRGRVASTPMARASTPQAAQSPKTLTCRAL